MELNEALKYAYEDGFNKALEIVDKIPPRKWISVNEDLPFSGDEVLVTDSFGELDICLFNKDQHGIMTWEDMTGVVLPFNAVKAWQYLPEPYKDN